MMSESSTITITVTIARTVYAKEDTGWRIVEAQTDEGDIYSLVGVFPAVVDGDQYRVTGTTGIHPVHGPQLKVHTITETDPLSPTRAYLTAVNGIGPVLARNITKRFGTDTITILNNNPERLIDVKGIGKSKLATILNAWDQYKNSAALGIIVAESGLGYGVTSRIIDHFKTKRGITDVAQIITILTDNPYLTMKAKGIGWETADALARTFGVEPDAPARITAAMCHQVEQAEKSGHCFRHAERLARDTASMLGIDIEACKKTLADISTSTDADDNDALLTIDVAPNGLRRVYTTRMWNNETATAYHLHRLIHARSDPGDPLNKIRAWGDDDWATVLADIKLDNDQKRAVRAAFASRVMVLTGGPGTGKTYTLKTIIQIMQQANVGLCLMAPTGRAAQRMAKVIGYPAATIHRVVGPLGDDNFIPEQFIIIDEVSMVDIKLAKWLLSHIRTGATVVFVGDQDQLPSVGPGKVLADIITSQSIPVINLTTVHRQSGTAGIVTVSHAINRGHVPELLPVSTIQPNSGDVYFLPASDPAQAANYVVDAAVAYLPQRMHVSPSDIQVLAPMRNGPDGINALNLRLQLARNSMGRVIEETVAATPAHQLRPILRVGDRVMQTVNNYELGVFNGSVGTILDVVQRDNKSYVEVAMDEADTISYPATDLKELTLAYAITIHKSQGSEYPVVVIPMTRASRIMQKRNLIYTGLTRARVAAMFVGSLSCIRDAAKTLDTTLRNTTLAERIISL